MKTPITLLLITILGMASCTKSTEAVYNIDVQASGNSQYKDYLIKKGSQFCDQNPYMMLDVAELKFMVKFDSSAIYQTIDPGNQTDINKLYGFSDNNTDHHQFSARFGWRWYNNQLEILGYIYNNGIMSFQKIGNIRMGEENNCSIKVTSDKYVFTLNNASITMPRSSTTATAIGYKLYPYFGGTEMAPHDMHIWIKDL